MLQKNANQRSTEEGWCLPDTAQTVFHLLGVVPVGRVHLRIHVHDPEQAFHRRHARTLVLVGMLASKGAAQGYREKQGAGI